MKALTVWQPWASLIIIGAKPYEFRGMSCLAYINPPKPGERIAIHAAARPVLADALLVNVLTSFKCRLLPLGAVLGTAVIGKPQPPLSPDHN
jgi:hypothetical protein